MSTSTLQLLPTSASEIAQLDPATLASIPGVAYDLKRLKVYSSCLRCRAKKVKCDRKEPCSRCEKHGVECSYRELASVQLDIRQFQRHLNNPKIRKDGAGIITSTATPIITLPSGDTASNPGSASSTDTESDTPTHASAIKRNNKALAMARAKVVKIQRRNKLSQPSTSSTFSSAHPSPTRDSFPSWPTLHPDQGHDHSQGHNIDDNQDEVEDEDDEEIERLVLRDSNEPATTAYGVDVNMSHSDDEHHDSGINANVPIWKARAVGKHKQTVHEQDLAETFGLAAYLKAKEMELSQDSGSAGQTIDYDMELERALAQRMPTSFSRPDRSYSRARKYAQAGYNPALPYARPSHCQLSGSSMNTPAVTATAQCCCQIAAKQGQAPGTCYYSNLSHGGYENTSAPSSMSPPPQSASGDTARIAYSPSYVPKDEPSSPQISSNSTPAVAISPAEYSHPQFKNILNSSTPSSSASSPRIELPPIYLPKLPPFPTTPASSDLSAFQVNRDTDKPLKIECKYNEPNVDAWDMIEKPLSRPVTSGVKRGRSVKMEMGWILS
ncbi:hypothetical protein BGZ94_002883 [Podila epigama]|nr:hypothetical protein BGZ94_002883 [Podila epigama]